MKPITKFQTLELVLIPIIFGFSQVFVLLFGLSIVGNDIWIIIGIPMGFGVVISLVFLVFFIRYHEISEFLQLESFFRLITISGGIALIIILFFQFFVQLSELTIIPLLSLIISVIGDIMTGMCIYFLCNALFIQDPLK